MERRRKWIVGIIVLGLLLGGLFTLSSVFAQDPYTVTEGTHFNATPGPEVILGENLETSNDQFFQENGTVDLGKATFSSDASPTVEAQGWDDEWTVLSQMDVNGSPLEVSVSNKQTIEVEGDADSFEYRDMVVDDGTVDFRYSGGPTDVVIQGTQAETVIIAEDADTGEQLDWAESTADDELTLSLPDGDRDVELRLSNEPEILNQTAEPTEGQSEPQSEFSVDIDHADFPATNVIVDFYHEGDHIGSDELSDTGEASVSEEVGTQAGPNEWHVVATDDYGNEVTSETFEYTTPSTLHIYNETDPDTLLNDVDVELEFYFENGETEVFERQASNGEIDMVGLPADQPFVVVADADDFHPRRIYLESLAQSENIYLLPQDVNYVDLTFDLQDYTGEYPERDTVMQIQRNLGGEWQTVQGDHFGGTGEFNAQLEYNVRHRLVLINTETDDRRVLGTLTPTADSIQTIEVKPDSVSVIEETGPTISVSPTARSLPAIDDASIGIDISGQGQSIQEWSVDIVYEEGGVTDQLMSETFGSNNLSISPEFNLSERTGQVTINVEVITEDGSQHSKTYVFNVRESFDNDHSLLSALGNTADSLGSDGAEGGATTFVAVLLTIIISGSAAGYLGASTEVTGGVAIGSISMFSIVGWVPASLLFAGCVTYLAFFALRRGI